MTESKVSSAFITGLALMIAAAIFGWFYYAAQAVANNRDSLSVTGSAKIQVTSDQAKLVIALSRIVASSDLASGYSGVAHDLNLTKDLLQKSGVTSQDIVESPVSMNQVYDQNNTTQTRYQLNQTVTLQLNDVNKITDISKKIPDLAAQGAIISIQSLEYYYSKLPDLRVSLLTQAVQDAKARAEKIAEGTGRHVGSVQVASSGVVQVLTPNSVDVSDYGSYDTSSIPKDVMVTVKASFRLQ
jgi:hypothetical protein